MLNLFMFYIMCLIFFLLLFNSIEEKNINKWFDYLKDEEQKEKDEEEYNKIRNETDEEMVERFWKFHEKMEEKKRKKKTM